MTVKTYTEQLEEVQTAISDILTGAQAYSNRGQSAERANLKTLYEAESRLRKMADREANGGIRVTGVTPVDS